MSAPPEKAGFKQKLAHEMREMLLIFLYLALFLCALATYGTLLLHEFHVRYFAYGTALLNSLVMSKVIMLGEYVRLGRRLEDKPLMAVAIFRAALFSLLMVVFHIVEESIKHLLHGHGPSGVVRELMAGGFAEIGARNLVIFCALIPFFASRELQRILGEEKLFDLFFRRRASPWIPQSDRKGDKP
jgi:hypothetical protein